MGKYNSQDIQILKGLEHVRRRPHMYIGDVGVQGLHHLLREVVDNAVDEFLDGHVTRIDIVLNPDKGYVEVRDNGRGIPVSNHPKAKMSTLTAVFTLLHAGGKFGKGAYTSAVVGLHGIGVKAVNALSDRLLVRTVRKGTVWEQEFSKGNPAYKVRKSSATLKKGTSVKFHPDEEIFGKIKWHRNLITGWLRDVSYLCPGLRISYTEYTGKVDKGYSVVFKETGGLLSAINKVIAEDDVLDDPVFVSTDNFDAAFCWTSRESDSWRSFVNVANTSQHGTHVNGIKKAVQDTLNDVSGQKYRGDDLRDGLVAFVHARVLEPQFKGQTKSRLENPEVEITIYEELSQFLTRYWAEHPDTAKRIIARAKKISAAKAKFRAEQKAIKGTKVKKGARGVLPWKLIEAPDCSPNERELFIVEGDSAENNVTKARITQKIKGKETHFQEVFPLKGKPPNAATTSSLASLVTNATIKDLVTAIGTGIGDSFDLSKCRYNTIYILADADPDGRHIVALLLALFVQHMPQLIESDMVKVVLNPLFIGTTAKKRVYGDSVEEVRKKFSAKDKPQIRRFKGLGESNPIELQEYAMDPKKRKTLSVEWHDDDEKLIVDYMGSDARTRKELLGLLE